MDFVYDSCSEHTYPGLIDHLPSVCQMCADEDQPLYSGLSTNLEDTKESTMSDEQTIRYEIETEPGRVYVDGVYLGETLDEVMSSRHAIFLDSPGKHSIEIIKPKRETVTLYPLARCGYRLDERPFVYLHVKPLRQRDKIKLINLWREMTDLGLKEAKDAVEQNDVLPLGQMSTGHARALQATLRTHFILEHEVTPDIGPLLYAEHP